MAGAAWESLGSFTITSGTLMVRLSDDADGTVLADAVRIASASNGPPTAVDDAYTTDGVSDLIVGFEGGVLANDTDPDLDTLSASVVSGPSYGSVVLNTDGSFTYTPDAGFTGPDSFTYEADDGQGGTDQATVTIVLNSGSPTADAGGPYSVDEGTGVVLDASASSDPDQTSESLVYEWDLDGDGVFGETGTDATRGDETGVSPTFSAAGLDGPLSESVSVRVTDDGGLSTTASVAVAVLNADPSLDLGSDVALSVGSEFTLTNSFTDPGPDAWTATSPSRSKKIRRRPSLRWRWRTTRATMRRTAFPPT